MISKGLQSLINAKFNDDVLFEIVSKKTNWKAFEINKIEMGCESKKGDNYLSTIVRFAIKATSKENSSENGECSIAVICKSLPSNIGRSKTFRSLDFFKNETKFYNNVWPALQEFQHSKGIKEEYNDFPLLLSFHQDGLNDFIALEDLSFQGYSGINRDVGLDFAHCQLILRQFAKFHALAYAFKDQHPIKFNEIAACLKETYFAEEFRTWYGKFQINLLKVVRDAVLRELPQLYADKFENLVHGDFFGKICSICARKSPFNVITHGDAWVPNFLAFYDSNQVPLRIKIIDFQLARCASLAMDITFFLYTCADEMVIEQHWDLLIEDYLKTFTAFARELGTDASNIKLEDLKREILECIPFALGMSMEAITMSLLEDHEVANIDDIQGDDGMPLEEIWIIHPFKCSSKRKRLVSILKHAVDNKFI